MKIITWILVVLPFVAIVWMYDVIVTGIKILYGKYYIYAYNRSSYLQERALIDAYVENCTRKGQSPWPGYN